jgi:hypothetical protein
MKNVIVIPATIPKEKNLSTKFGGWEWMEISIKAWTYWCEKNDVELVIYDKPQRDDLMKYRITLQRWFDVHDLLDEKNIEWDNVALIDACSVPKWDCPNFFELTDNKFCVGREKDNLKWVYESVQGYKEFFDNYELNIADYFCTQFVIHNKSHKKLIKDWGNFFLDNIDELNTVQKRVDRGTDQTPINYFMQMNNVEMSFLPIEYRVSHLHRKNFLQYNWQLDEDKTPFYIKYGKIWFFSGFDKTVRNKLMVSAWKSIGKMYER